MREKRTRTEIYYGKPKEKIESMEILSRYTNIPILELKKIIEKNRSKGKFYFNDEIFYIVTKEYSVVVPCSKKKEKKSTKRVTRFVITDIKDREEVEGQFFAKIYINGVPESNNTISSRIGCGNTFLSTAIKDKTQLRINGDLIEIKYYPIGTKFYTLDGKVNIPKYEIADILGWDKDFSLKQKNKEDRKGHTLKYQIGYVYG